jgi:hypothetical protein
LGRRILKRVSPSEALVFSKKQAKGGIQMSRNWLARVILFIASIATLILASGADLRWIGH